MPVIKIGCLGPPTLTPLNTDCCHGEETSEEEAANVCRVCSWGGVGGVEDIQGVVFKRVERLGGGGLKRERSGDGGLQHNHLDFLC